MKAAVWFISGETWSKEQLAALGQPASFIVDGTLTFDDDVTEEDIKASVSSRSFRRSRWERIKGILYPYLRVNNGSIIVKGRKRSLQYW